MVYTFFGRLNFRMCTVRYCQCDIDVTTVSCTCNGDHDCLSPRALAMMYPPEPEQSDPEQIYIIAGAIGMFVGLLLVAAVLYKICQKRTH